MFKYACLCFAIIVALPAWSQVTPQASGGDTVNEPGDEMRTPPSVSNQAYPSVTGDESRSNYLHAGFSANFAYDDNVLGYATSTPTGSTIYTIYPTFSVDKLTPRMHGTLSYNPGFTFYQSASLSSLNSVNQSGALAFQYRMSSRFEFNLRDNFQKSSNVFNQLYPLGGPITGSSQDLPQGALAPFAEEQFNTASGELSYQMSMNAMIGGSGSTTKLTYPDPAQVPGLYDSSSDGGSVFLNRRFTISQYAGVTYQYSRFLTGPGTAQIETQTHTVNFFYTYFGANHLTVSLSGGPQYFNTSYPSLPVFAAWTPAVTTSIGWQKNRFNCAASYSRSVNNGGGLLGAFHSNSAAAFVRWQVTRNWTLGPAASYYTNSSVDPLTTTSDENGHSVTGSFSADRTLGRRMSADFRYDRLDYSYPGVPALASTDSNRESVSISWQFDRPLGR